MKTKKYLNNLVWITIILTGISCQDFLDKDPVEIITPEQVWKDPKLINGVLVRMYDRMQFEDFNYWGFDANWQNRNLSTMSDESQGGYQAAPVFSNAGVTYTYEDDLFGTYSTPYAGIRNCNDFLLQLETATLDDSEKATLNMEVRFIRAWHYFSLVKRYGGVPLITVSQIYTGDNEKELQIPRTKEEEIYNFIINECKEVAKVLPRKWAATGQYRVTEGAAWALCSRAALYAGSIAKYGRVQLDGIVGISPNKADEYFQIAYEASENVINSGIYSLYNSNPNKAENFRELFMKGKGETVEYIFQKTFNPDNGKGHDFDKMNAPYTYTQGGWGCATSPVLELVEAFEYIDGSEGALQLTNPDGSPRRFENLLDVYEGKDPRLFASVFLSGTPCKGGLYLWQRGIIDSNGSKIQATRQPNANEIYTDPVTGITYNISGKDGGADVGDPSKTSFHQRKFWDNDLQVVAFGRSATPWPVFRLAEMYLNAAEAAFELGNRSLALQAINPVRERAGIKILTESDLSINKVRNERKIELAFENHRYWDLRRWRIADLSVAQGGLEGFRGSALHPWFDTRDNKYIFERSDSPPKQIRSFLEKHYYVKIGVDDMNSNPQLVQNPGHTN